MQLSQHLSQKQTMSLRQVLSPQLIQQMKTFQMPYYQVLENVQRESEDNVFIEITQEDTLYPTSHRKLSARADGDGESFHNAIDLATASESLSDHLMTQLSLTTLRDQESEIVKRLIDELDDRGYLTNYQTVKDQIKKAQGVSDRKVGECLKILQTFEPDGVGARTVRECLLLQVESYQFEDDRLRDVFKQVISVGLEKLANEEFDELEEKTGYPLETLEMFRDFIQDNLTPNPGSKFNPSNHTHHIVPSFRIELEDDQVKMINLEKTQGVQFNLSDKYLKMLSDPNLDKESKHFLEEKLKKAKNLVDMIEKRQRSLENLMKVVVNKQLDFFKGGLPYLDPLLQKELAEVTDVSPSTVSRILSSKYVETPHGVYLLRSLCPRRIFGTTANKVREMIADIAQKKPNYSDLKISSVLKEKGVNIARRTVTKYRRQADVSSSYKRN